MKINITQGLKQWNFETEPAFLYQSKENFQKIQSNTAFAHPWILFKFDNNFLFARDSFFIVFDNTCYINLTNKAIWLEKSNESVKYQKIATPMITFTREQKLKKQQLSTKKALNQLKSYLQLKEINAQ